jgi:hypothetical protein
MAHKVNKNMAAENEVVFQFLNEKTQGKLDEADANPFIKISVPDKNIPFIVLEDGGVIADITVNNPLTILKNIHLPVHSDKHGAGFIDVFHGNKTLVFRPVESSIFEMKWRVDDIASALQVELNLYYPEYKIRSH